jgi:hypothetical protein
MRPAFFAMFAGVAAASAAAATSARAGVCAVDTDCLDNGLGCGTDVCSKSGTCVAAGTDPGTCMGVANCKCYGLYSALCNPENHSCTITSQDGGINGGTGDHDSGFVTGTYDSGGSTGDTDAGASLPDDDSGVSGGGSTSGSNASAGSSGTVAGASAGATAASGSGGATSGDQAASGSTLDTSGVSSGGLGASTAPSKSSSGCAVGFEERTPYGLFAILLGACAWLRRARRSPHLSPG